MSFCFEVRVGKEVKTVSVDTGEILDMLYYVVQILYNKRIDLETDWSDGERVKKHENE